LRGQAAGTHYFIDGIHRHMLHIMGIVGLSKQCWGYLVNPFVGALSAEQYSHQQLKMIAVIQGHRRLWVQLVQPLYNKFSALFF